MTWPTSIPTRESLLAPVNNFVCFLVGDISAIQNSISITTKTVGLSTLPPKGMVSIDSEAIYYDGINSSGAYPVLLNCVRGYDGTQASPHVAGTRTEVRWIAGHHNVLADLAYALVTSLGSGILDSAMQWGGTAPSYDSLADKLNKSLPRLFPQSGTVWTCQHDRRRPVAVQLWVVDAVNPNLYTQMDARSTQVIDASGVTPSTVTVETLPAAKSGYIIIC